MTLHRFISRLLLGAFLCCSVPSAAAPPKREIDPEAAARSGQGAAEAGDLPVSEKGLLRVVGRMDDLTNGQGSSIASKDRFVYLAMLESKEVVLVYDLANPAKPRKIGSIPAAGWVRSIKVLGDVGATFGVRGGPSAITFENPERPQVLKGDGGVPMVMLPPERFPSALLQRSSVVGELLFTPGVGGVNIWNIADTQQPLQMGVAPKGISPGIDGKTEFLVANRRLYIQAEKEVVAYDLTQPEQPRELGRFDISVLGDKALTAFPAAADGNRLYLLTRNGTTTLTGNAALTAKVLGGVAIVDVSNPAAMKLLGTTFIEGIQSRLTGATVVQEKTLAVSDLDFGLRVFDVANPTHPKVIASDRRGGEVSAMTVSGDFVYLGQNLGGGLWVMDVTDKTKPRKRGVVPTGTEIWGDLVAVKNDYVYFCESSHAVSGLGVADVRDPDNPQLVARIPGAFSYGLAIRGNRVYCGDGKIFDISSPAQPQLLPQRLPLTLGRVADGRDLQIEGNRLYLSLQDRAEPFFAVLDLTDSDQPTLLGKCNLWTRMHRINLIAIAGNTAYLSGGTNLEGPAAKAGLTAPIALEQDPFSKVTAIDLREPAQPKIVAKWTMDQLGFSRDWDDRLNSVNVWGDRLFVTQYSGWTNMYALPLPAGQSPHVVDKIKAGYWSWRTLRQDRWLYCARLEGLDIIEIVPEK